MENKVMVENFRIVPIDEIYPDPSNTNNHPTDQINMLVEQFKIQGFRDPLIVDKSDGLLVCGEGRLIAAKKAGMKELPVIYQDFDSINHKKAFITAHNATNKWSEIDLAKVNLEVIEMGPDFDLSWLALKDFVIEPLEGVLPDLNTSEPDCQQMTFVVSNEQKDIIDEAIAKAKKEEDCSDELNENSNGNALAAIVKRYVYG